jgi:AcrR family transcriptional regulator
MPRATLNNGRPRSPGRGRRPPPPPAAGELRQRILETAAEVFAREGYRNTDLQDVADALRIGKASVYRRFASKRELFFATVDHGMLELRAAVDAAVAPVADPLEQIAVAIRTYLAFFDTHPQFVELLIQERAEFRDRTEPTYFAHRRTGISRWRQLYRDLIEAGRVRPMPVERISDVMSSAVYGTMFTNFFAGHDKSSEEQSRDILDVVFHGILAPAGSRVAAGRARAGRTRKVRR